MVAYTATHSALLLVRYTQYALQSLHRESTRLLHGNGQVAHGKHARPVRRPEPQLDLCPDLLLVGHLWVVHKRTAAGVRGLVAGGGILQALDDGGLTATIVTYDDGDGREELYDGYLLVVEATYATDG